MIYLSGGIYFSFIYQLKDGRYYVSTTHPNPPPLEHFVDYYPSVASCSLPGYLIILISRESTSTPIQYEHSRAVTMVSPGPWSENVTVPFLDVSYGYYVDVLPQSIRHYDDFKVIVPADPAEAITKRSYVELIEEDVGKLQQLPLEKIQIARSDAMVQVDAVAFHDPVVPASLAKGATGNVSLKTIRSQDPDWGEMYYVAVVTYMENGFTRGRLATPDDLLSPVFSAMTKDYLVSASPSSYMITQTYLQGHTTKTGLHQHNFDFTIPAESTLKAIHFYAFSTPFSEYSQHGKFLGSTTITE